MLTLVKTERSALPSTNHLIETVEAANTSAEIAIVVAEAQDALAEIASRIKAARAELLDPRRTDTEAAEIKAELDQLDLKSGRTAAALSQINQRLNAVRDAEAAEARRAAYNQALAERDQLVKDLAAYPVLAGKIADLLRRIEESDAAIEALAQGGWRTGEPPIKSAERIARGFGDGAIAHPLVHTTQLPQFEASKTNGWHMFTPRGVKWSA